MPDSQLAEHQRPTAPAQPQPSEARSRLADTVGGGGFEAQSSRLTPAPLDPIQRKGGAATDVHAAAAHGISGAGGALPHGAAIQQSFGAYDLSNVTAHTDSVAAEGSAAMGAEAYATGSDIAFAGAPDLHTAAHEAAHVVQQRAGVALSGGVGQAGDAYEQHADKVADAVVAGKSAEPVLAEMGGGGAGGGEIQRRAVQRAVQRVDAPGAPPTTDQSQPGGQQTVLSGIDVARNPPTTPGQPGTPVEAATQASIDDPLKHPYYESTFKRRVVALFASGKVAAPAQPPEAIAQDIWLKVCSAVKASMPAMDDPTTYSNWARKWVDMKTPGFESAIAQFANVASSLAGYASTQFANARSFGFWSKPEGRELGESICDVTLETSGVGALFDGLPSLNANGAGWDPQIWGALSRGYAEAVAGAVSVGGKRVHVCVGAGAPPDNIWAIVESKALAKGLESARLALEDVVTYHGAAATTKNDRKLDRARKSGSGAFPGCVYSGDSRADAATAADTHYAGLP